ncbi:hypothetical protein V757_03250 [Pelistega indica]|uniref:Uncharacterized protein n=1 Tax=Pelistega indica TaxID=1414851 RepID=V8G7U3_9BURK|nr:hypothetical protein [Pelistega indica]ETD72604.1 hypothetical protein V757_03250 [Pelistega indica]
MTRPHEDLTGQRFGQLTAESYLGQNHWRCRCTCGGTRDVRGAYLKNGRATACLACKGRAPIRKSTKFVVGATIDGITLMKYLGAHRWEALCACGNHFATTQTTIENSHFMMCPKCTLHINRAVKKARHAK